MSVLDSLLDKYSARFSKVHTVQATIQIDKGDASYRVEILKTYSQDGQEFTARLCEQQHIALDYGQGVEHKPVEGRPSATAVNLEPVWVDIAIDRTPTSTEQAAVEIALTYLANV